MGVRVTLKALRTNSDLTQEEIAKKIGVSVDTWSSWEKYKTYPSSKQVVKILEAFEVNFNDVKFV